MRRHTQTTVMLGVAQTLSWASSYYLPAVLAEPISRAVGMGYSAVFAAFSAALLVSAATGPVAGRFIDRLGGRPVLIASNLVFAAGLAILSQATHASHVFLAWAIMGAAMGSGLYDPLDPLAERRPLDDKAFAIDHFEVKLFRLADGFQTAAGARMAKERTERLRAIRDMLLDEI